MRKVVRFVNAVGFTITLAILLALVETHVIREWVFDVITLNLGIYFLYVRNISKKLANYENQYGK